MSCIFCQIAKKELSSSLVYETDQVVAFKDISPIAPVHILVIPKDHYDHLLLAPADVLMNMHVAIKEIAKDFDLEARGFRVLTNIGVEGGQSVPHLHFHIVGGRSMTWPPG